MSVIARARWALCGVFWLSGVVCALWSAALPAVNERLHLGELRLGAVLLTIGIGTLVTMPIVGRLCDRWTSRRVLGVVASAAAISLLGPALAPSYQVLLVGAFALGGGLGALDVAMNAHAIEVEREYGRPIMSAFHGVWSLGGVAGSAVIAAGLYAGADIRALMAAGALVSGLLSLVPVRFLLPGRSVERAARNVADDRQVGPIRYPAVILLGVIALCACVSEGGANDWAALHASDVLGVDPGLASLAYTIFAMTMTVARLLGDGLTRRLGPERTVRWAGSTAVAGYGLVLLATWLPGADLPVRTVCAYAGWALAGLGLATVLPVALSAVGSLHGSGAGAAGRVLSWVTMFGYVGLLSGPAMIGPLAEATSLGTAMLLPAGLGVVIAFTGPFAVRMSGRLDGTRTDDQVQASRP
ncbi:MFS transporter [Streptosporangium sp. NPDC000396]|uniref:MFS transporter n=1 Tax=Streptosporangium sp. NPDC000396 TaxID=3366185 RepID=UPI0036AD2CEE